jgi:hypothetical protein
VPTIAESGYLQANNGNDMAEPGPSSFRSQPVRDFFFFFFFFFLTETCRLLTYWIPDLAETLAAAAVESHWIH